MRKLVIALVVIAAGSYFALQNQTLQDHLMAAVIKSRMAQDTSELFQQDALNAMVCGSTSPFPSPKRAGPCIAIFAGDKFYIVDVGSRSWNNLALRGISAEKLGGIFITHFHSDHIAELGEYNMQSWAAGRDANLKIYGGQGIENIVAGFNQAYAHDRGFRIEHHGADYLKPETAEMVAAPITQLPKVIMQDGKLTITAFAVDHDPIDPALGYRFDYGDRSLVVSGDTVKSQSLINASKDADVLFHEAQAQHMVQQLEDTAKALGRHQLAKIFFDIRDYHTSPVEAAESAAEANVKELVLYHLTPPPPNKIAEKIFMRDVEKAGANSVQLAHDGLFYSLPLNSNTIQRQTIKAP
ncbi:MAG: MBL fold metallo-hydrolase [Gammaproteobacteria bacterium]|nr:MBL fold metallo-hydrolase [Gammaproteobacteria bacterium]